MKCQFFGSLGHRTYAYSITVLFPIFGFMYALFFKINCFFQGIVKVTKDFEKSDSNQC